MVNVMSWFPPTEGYAKFLVSEAQGYASREEGVVASGAGKLLSGTILGKRTRGAAAPTSAAIAGNTGNGTIGGLTLDPGAPAGTWQVRFQDATHFTVFRPDGSEEGRGTTGVAYNGGVNFTITAGGTAFVIGDGFNIVAAWGAGTQELVPAAEGATDGTDRAAGILLSDIDATDASVRVALVVRNAEVQRAKLEFAGTPSQGFQDAAYAALAASGIAFR